MIIAQIHQANDSTWSLTQEISSRVSIQVIGHYLSDALVWLQPHIEPQVSSISWTAAGAGSRTWWRRWYCRGDCRSISWAHVFDVSNFSVFDVRVEWNVCRLCIDIQSLLLAFLSVSRSLSWVTSLQMLCRSLNYIDRICRNGEYSGSPYDRIALWGQESSRNIVIGLQRCTEAFHL